MTNRLNITNIIGRYAVILVLVLTLAALVVQARLLSSNDTAKLGIFASWVYYDLDELIQESEGIVIAEVGEIASREYPLRTRPLDYTEEELAILGDDYLDTDRVAYHQLAVEEVLKGDVEDNILLVRTDVDYYAEINLSKLEPTQRVLLFLYKDPIEQQLYTNHDDFYSGFADSGIFDLEENRAYPRAPIAFRDTEETFYIRDNPARPYFELDKLRGAIQDK